MIKAVAMVFFFFLLVSPVNIFLVPVINIPTLIGFFQKYLVSVCFVVRKLLSG